MLITADNERCGTHALDHAVNLFGPDHRYVVIGVHRHRDERSAAERLVRSIARSAPDLTESLVVSGDAARAVCETARRYAAAAVVVGVDVGSGDRTAPSPAFRVLRGAPCPVVMVATEAT
ncbi:universal stress protein [Actinospongicola halichondriae]|uniref:universal stress protein n=1 Tax=Actinospongicola halichondriae TaxID=3236844 RepID=UPI003D5A1220